MTKLSLIEAIRALKNADRDELNILIHLHRICIGVGDHEARWADGVVVATEIIVRP